MHVAFRQLRKRVAMDEKELPWHGVGIPMSWEQSANEEQENGPL
jgi:hypothetical protein